MSYRTDRVVLAGLLGAVTALAPAFAAAASIPDFDGKGGAGAGGASSGVPTVTGEAKPLMMWTSEAVVNVYSELAEPIPNPGPDDSIQLDGKTLWRGTQLDKGEQVEVTEERPDGWWHVNVPDQNYSGWVRYQSTPAPTPAEPSPAPRAVFGSDSKLASAFPRVAIPPRNGPMDPSREAFLKTAEGFLGVPYVWGGRSPSGVDCSGLVQLSFSYIGMGNQVPRTAAEQQKASRPVDPRTLRPGDLIFFRNSSGRIHHVAIYTGGSDGGTYLQAPYTGARVSFADLGFDLKSTANGQQVGRNDLFYGTFFRD